MNITIPPLQSSFLSCEKDVELILKKLFVENRTHSETLKKLLVIPNKDCLSNNTNEKYREKISQMSVAKLIEEEYIVLKPKIRFKEHEAIKSYIALSFDNFVPNNTNPEFRDCMLHFDIICHTDCWDLGDYKMRPLKIAGYIDGILNKTRLSGIGTFQFAGCSELILNEELSGYTLSYWAIHGGDDKATINEQ